MVESNLIFNTIQEEEKKPNKVHVHVATLAPLKELTNRFQQANGTYLDLR